MFDLPPGQQAAIYLHREMILNLRQLIAGTVRIDDADELRRFMMDLTGSVNQTEAAVERWRKDLMARGEKPT